MDGTATLNPVRTIGKYQIVGKIADGANGSVLKGHDPATGAVVAVKLAAMSLLRDPVLVKRFEQEFRTTSNLRHPNIVRGLEFGWQGDRPYIVMEYIDGEDMWTRIERQGKLPEAEAVGYITQVAQGLHEAHKHGIIHRDIKPDNILLTADGDAKLADLGLSKDLEENLELTRPDRGLGTPNFIAPEQFGDAMHAGVRCDIYSLGATLHMALTGQLPFDGMGLASILQMKLANDFAGPRKLVKSVSEHVDWAVRRAVLADPERRFATCREFIAALAGENSDTARPATGKTLTTARRPRRIRKTPAHERRKNLRFECALPTSCVINLSLHADAPDCLTPWDAKVCDLSVSGIGVLMPRRFEPGSMLTVELTSSDGGFSRKREMRVLRVASAEANVWFHGGLLTEKLSKEELRQLL